MVTLEVQPHGQQNPSLHHPEAATLLLPIQNVQSLGIILGGSCTDSQIGPALQHISIFTKEGR